MMATLADALSRLQLAEREWWMQLRGVRSHRFPFGDGGVNFRGGTPCWMLTAAGRKRRVEARAMMAAQAPRGAGHRRPVVRVA